MTMINRLWVEKYRPQTLDDYVWQDESQKSQILRFLKDGEIPHLLLKGIQGSGKTTLSKILVRELIDEDNQDIDVMLINASDENSVDTIRDKITNFAEGYSLGKFKIVQLEEMDYLTPNAQAVLRQVMEECSDTCRFIGTCNYDNKIIPALKSRMQEFNFKAPNKDQIMLFVANILAQEGVEITTQEHIDILHRYIDVSYPDIRKLINLLQQNIVDGNLVPPSTDDKAGDYKFVILDLLQSNNFRQLRKTVCDQVGRDEFDDVYRFLYENIHLAPKFSKAEDQEAAIVIIGDYLNRHAIVGDPEINIAGMFIKLGML